MFLGIIASQHRHEYGGMKIVLSLAVIGSLVFGVWNGVSSAQKVLTDRVSITTGQGQLFGLTSREGIARQVLGAGEEVLTIEAKGVTGFVQTTERLLGFSGQLQRWVSFPTSTAEHILKWTVTSRMIIVHGEQAMYGFQSDRGRWKRAVFGAGERLKQRAVKDSIAVFVTNRRALGFSSFTGGFFPRDLPVDNSINDIQINDSVIILHLSDSMLVFRSGLAIWAQLP